MRKRRAFLWIGLGILSNFVVFWNALDAAETYRVQRGDNLFQIAAKTGVTLNALKKANRLPDNRIKAGQTLVIPSSNTGKRSESIVPPGPRVETYVVKKGDTLFRIARRAGVSVAELQERNHLRGSALSIGQKLVLKKSTPGEDTPSLSGRFVNGPVAEADGVPPDPEEASASIARLKKENAALLGKWSNPDEPKLLVKAAMGFLGTPYRLGGFSMRGIDCSGLVKKVYALFDIDLPRTANEQSHVGMRVTRSELSVGDLLFFNTRTNGGHVGIYIGNNEFVHAASQKRGVRVDRLDTPYFSKHFIRATRLMGKGDDSQFEESSSEPIRFSTNPNG